MASISQIVWGENHFSFTVHDNSHKPRRGLLISEGLPQFQGAWLAAFPVQSQPPSKQALIVKTKVYYSTESHNPSMIVGSKTSLGTSVYPVPVRSRFKLCG